jgi:MFS family permease
MFVQYLIGGTTSGAMLIIVAFLLSRFAGDRYGRALLVIFLFVAVGTYVGFAVGAEASGLWQLAQIGQAIALGAMALRGLHGSPYWLAAAWALHVVWDYPLHYLGPGHAFTPESWAVPCISFDLLVAAYIVVAYRFDLVGEGRQERLAASRAA